MSLLFKQFIKSASRRNCSYRSVRRPETVVQRKRNEIQLGAGKKPDASKLANQIRARIMATGPITIAEYMKEVLTNPKSGYYMNRDVFGKEGDFITSPEISQIFGELVAVWILMEWRKIGSPTPFQIVELGPGRGTLARDLLKVLTKFIPGRKCSFHMVEISPYLSNMQAQQLCYKHEAIEDPALPYYHRGETLSGTNVFWHRCLEDVPQQFSVVVAHEFFDALPIHKLQLDSGIWKEILIDVDETKAKDFRYVISNSQTPISRMYRAKEGEPRQCLEYSLETDRIVEMLANRFERDGGFGLFMDYGHYGDKSDTFRAFRKHKLHDPLEDAGTADLTADVDFSHMKRVAEKDGKVICFGPVEQGFFLKQMQGDARLEQLLQNSLPENEDAIKMGYRMLTDPTQMGARFKFFSMFPAVLKDHLAKFKINGFY